MLSKYVEFFNKNNPLNEYPRPQLVRESYLNLNGAWDFCLSTSNELPVKYDKKIIVPYCMESILSDINESNIHDLYMYYRKSFILNKNITNDKILLHIDAVDQYCEIYINNNFVITNNNGYLPIIVDIKPFLNKNENEIVLKVKDELSTNYLYGKQAKKRGGMWYTPVSGVWQTIWIEGVSDDYVKELTITPDIDNNVAKIIVNSSSDDIKLEVFENKRLIYKEKNKTGLFNVNIDNPILWSPEQPFLYDLRITTKNDVISSYFAMRKFSCNDKHFILNNKPYFIHGLLDQGYFPDGIYTPASYKAFEDDILYMKSLGFNCLRKHIKIEPLIYYHYCDKYGMIVIQDMVNNGSYSFFLDTALPTIGIKKIPLSFKKTNNKQKEIFKQSMIDTINYLYNVPCIAIYTIFNEGWGQHNANDYYQLARQIDNSRLYDSTSGWFKEKNSDFESLHVYFKKISLNNIKTNKPIIVSEFGGYAIKINNHVFNENNEYGYKKFNSLEDFNEAIYDLYLNDIIGNIKNNLAGCIYTQVSDVEDEINGLLTYDRKILKVDKQKMISIKNKIDKEFYHD